MANKIRVTRAEVTLTEIKKEAIIALHETEGVGPLTIDKLIRTSNHFGNGFLRHAELLTTGDWRELGAFPKQAIAIRNNMQPEWQARRAKQHLDKGLSMVTLLEEDYPEMLRHIADPPWVLYYKGNINLFRLPSISIVGTRVATSYGRRMAEAIAAGCAQRMTVVSGLAKGIDTAAHLGALRMPYSTIAVLAGSLDIIYPPENKALYQEIAHKGLLVTETPPNLPLAPGLFPLRNRIIAGLSRGVIVVEAAESSGALITADLSFNYGRDVFIIPGPMTSPKSEGALKYIRKGGILILDETDIFQFYSEVLPVHSPQTEGTNAAPSGTNTKVNLTEEELIIYHILLEQPHSIDELTRLSGMTFGHLHSVLLSLLLKRRINQQPGSVYTVL